MRLFIVIALSLFAFPLLAQTTPSATQPFITGAKKALPGDELDLSPLKLNLGTLQATPIVKSPSPDVQMVFSDMPEYFRTGDGIALQETVKPGLIRFYLYHCPTPDGKPHVISSVIENLGPSPLHLKMLRYCPQKPTLDYLAAGKKGLLEYFQSNLPAALQSIREIKTREVFDPTLETNLLKTDMLIHGLYEFEIDQPARITVFQRDPAAESLQAVDSLPKLPRILVGKKESGAGRGVFTNCDIDVTTADPINLSAGPAKLIVADGKTDPWIEGKDALDPAAKSLDKGNYGVIYHFKLQLGATGGKAVAMVMLNPFAGRKYCDVSSNAVVVNPGLSPGGVIPLPRERGVFNAFPNSVLIQRYAPVPEGQTQSIDLLYSPPGANCLPLPILLIPYDE